MGWAFLLCWLGYWSLDNLNIYTYVMLCFTNNGIIRIDGAQFAYFIRFSSPVNSKHIPKY